MERFRRQSKKVLIGIVGGLVVVVGLIMIPYPGPGWLVVFAGLAILATEFTFASKLLDFAKGKYDQWVDWLKRQNTFVRIAVLGFTGLVIVVTLWLLNAFGIVNQVLQLPFDWVGSPFFK